MLQLRIVGSSKPPIWLVKDSITIGSSDQCDLILENAESLHAEIRLEDDQLYFVTFYPAQVDDHEATEPVVLSHGSNLTVAGIELAVWDPKVERSAHVSNKSSNKLDVGDASSHWSIVSLSTALSGKRVWVNDHDVVGRAKECEICLAVNHLSRRHARFLHSGEELVVEDLESANGTFVNGERIQKKRLWHGDEVRFDTLVFRVVAPGKNDAAEDENDKTSLRPSISKNQLTSAIKDNQAAVKTPVKIAPSDKPSFNKLVPSESASASGSQATGSNSTLLWGGGVIIVVTLLILFYLTS